MTERSDVSGYDLKKRLVLYWSRPKATTVKSIRRKKAMGIGMRLEERRQDCTSGVELALEVPVRM